MKIESQYEFFILKKMLYCTEDFLLSSLESAYIVLRPTWEALKLTTKELEYWKNEIKMYESDLKNIRKCMKYLKTKRTIPVSISCFKEPKNASK